MGIPGKPVPSDDVLRDAVRRAWAESRASLHTLGRAIGLSPAGLLKFVNGAVPRAGTRKKLLDWYIDQPPVQGELTRIIVEPALVRTAPGLSDEARTRAIQAYARSLREEYRRAGTQPPPWVTQFGGD